jgi:hypothetical protein
VDGRAAGQRDMGRPHEAARREASDTGRPEGENREPLTDAEAADLRRMRQRDREVRDHEQAHVSAGGSLITRGARYEYRRGPDGQRYAVGGEVQIDTSPAREPEATAAKMRQVQSAALAPAQPSPQDRSVAGAAARKESLARAEAAAQAAAQAVQETAAAGPDARPPADAGREAAPAGAG